MDAKQLQRRKTQWKNNANERRKRVIAEGGRQLYLLIDAETAKALSALEEREGQPMVEIVSQAICDRFSTQRLAHAGRATPPKKATGRKAGV